VVQQLKVQLLLFAKIIKWQILMHAMEDQSIRMEVLNFSKLLTEFGLRYLFLMMQKLRFQIQQQILLMVSHGIKIS